MKTCSNCGRQIEENDFEPENPAEALGDLFHESVNSTNDSEICPACKKELGVLSLIGFGE